jgi:hypothetical protein
VSWIPVEQPILLLCDQDSREEIQSTKQRELVLILAIPDNDIHIWTCSRIQRAIAL